MQIKPAASKQGVVSTFSPVTDFSFLVSPTCPLPRFLSPACNSPPKASRPPVSPLPTPPAQAFRARPALQPGGGGRSGPRRKPGQGARRSPLGCRAPPAPGIAERQPAGPSSPGRGYAPGPCPRRNPGVRSYEQHPRGGGARDRGDRAAAHTGRGEQRLPGRERALRPRRRRRPQSYACAHPDPRARSDLWSWSRAREPARRPRLAPLPFLPLGDLGRPGAPWPSPAGRARSVAERADRREARSGRARAGRTGRAGPAGRGGASGREAGRLQLRQGPGSGSGPQHKGNPTGARGSLTEALCGLLHLATEGEEPSPPRQGLGRVARGGLLGSGF